jgi:hypothetical protein
LEGVSVKQRCGRIRENGKWRKGKVKKGERELGSGFAVVFRK